MANMAYASDYDRQFTGCPDDIGIVGGDPNVYNDTVGCMGQLLAGYDQNGELFGAWCGGNLCEGVAGDPLTRSLTFHLLYQPLSYNVPPSAIVFGGFPTPNNKAFNSYVGSRFYDPIFWAPKDVITQRLAEPFFEYPEEFRVPENEAEVGRIVWSSYVESVRDVPSRRALALRLQEPVRSRGLQVARLGQCRFPDMKTWMLEHHLPRTTSRKPTRASTARIPPCSTSYNSVPITLFFDGHVAPVGVREAMDADGRARNLHQSNNLCGNCTTNTGCETDLAPRHPARIDGYYGQYSYDTLVNSSYHILTTDGIQCRDVLSAQ